MTDTILWRRLDLPGHGISTIKPLIVSAPKQREALLNGVDCPAVAGCTDIDLGFSPSTNLLPIRRLSLEVGDTGQSHSGVAPVRDLHGRDQEGEPRSTYWSCRFRLDYGYLRIAMMASREYLPRRTSRPATLSRSVSRR